MMRIAATVRSVLIALMLTLSSGGVIALTTTSTAAQVSARSIATPVVGIKYPGGPGHPSSVFAHVWELNGKRGPCIDFGSITGDGDGTRVITRIPGMNAEQSKRAFTLIEKYRFTTSNETAAALAFATWSLRGDKDFRTWFRWAKNNNIISKSVLRRMNQMLKESKSHGPYTVKVSLQSVDVGKRGIGTVTVLDSRGKAAKRMPVKVKATTKGVKLNKVRRATNVKGKLSFKFKRVRSGKAGFKAMVTAPSVKKALLSEPSAGRQRLVVGGFRDTASGSAEFDKRSGAPTISTVCDTDCDGQATITVSYRNPKGSGPVRWVVKAGGVKVAEFDVRSGRTGTKQFRSVDGTVLSMSYCTLSKIGGKCTSRPTRVKKKYEVVCPAWAEAVLAIPCSCDPNKSGSITFTAPAGSPRHYTGVVSIAGGVVVHEVQLTNGEAAFKDIGKIKPGSTIEVSFTVYRDAARTVPLGTHVLQSVTVN